MKKIRTIIIFIVGILFSIIAFSFIRSLGSTYIESSSTSYEISGMKGGNNTQKFNNTIQKFSNKHNISAIKVFNVVEGGASTDIVTKMHVYGKKIALPAKTQATATEFETSDLRYPIYFVGDIKKATIENMFKREGIRYSPIHENWNTDIVVFLTTNNVIYILLLILLVLFIVLVLTNLYAMKEINIKVLLGMSNFEDAAISFGKDQLVFTAAFGIGLILVALYMKMQSYLYAYKIMLYFSLFLYLVATLVMIVGAVIRGLIHSRYTIIGAIKGDKKSKFSFYLNLFIKVLIEVFICISLFSLLNTQKSEKALSDQLNVWMNHKTFYTVSENAVMTKGSETSYLNRQSMKLFHYLDQKGGMLVDYQGWDSPQDVGDLNNGNVMTVNAQYLKENRVVGENGNRIILPKNSPVTYVLIPQQYYSERANLIKSYRRSLALDDTEKQLGRKLETKAINIKNNQKLFTYSTYALSLGNYSGTVKNAVLVVISNNSLGGLNSKLDSNMNWDSYMSNSAFLSPTLSAVKAGIQKTNIKKYIGSILNTKSYAAKQLESIRTEMLLSLVVTLVAFAIALVENVAFNSVYFNNNSKKLAIQRIFGGSASLRFGKFIRMIFVLSLIEALIVFMFTGSISISLGLIIVSNIVEWILLAVQGMYLDKHTWDYLKGE